MHYATLPSMVPPVSRLAFGCMSLKPGPEAIALLREAATRGITLFDTADLYDKGANEALVGEALRPFRQQVLLATKVGNQWKEDGTGWTWNPSRDYILKAADESLRRLQTDVIDLYQLHGGTLEDPFDEALEAFTRLQQQGKIRHYGISSIRPNVIRRWVEQASPATVMMQYSLLDRRPEESALPLLLEKGIGLLARGSLAQGLLVNKPARDYLGHHAASVSRVQERLQPLGQRGAISAALHFALAGGASAVVVGMRTGEQLTEALEALESAPPSPNLLQELKDVAGQQFYTEHR
jgi:aryl-alcohol dehydrogenase-like predicted oxidoreductase